MEWFDKLFKRQPKQTKFAPTLDGFLPIYSQFGTNIYASDVVQQVLKCIVDEMKKLNPTHVRLNDAYNDPTPVKSTVQDVLNNPNEIMTTSEFLEKTIWILPDKWVVALQYRVLVGRWPNLKKPKRFTEKVNWYKLNYHDPMMTQCVDKHLEKNYLKEKGFEEYLPKTLQVGASIEEIDFDALPEAFIIKCNNGYRNNVVVRNKSKMKYSMYGIPLPPLCLEGSGLSSM